MPQPIEPSHDPSNQKLVDQHLAAKAHLTDFVFEAEDEVATALEAYSAEQLSRWSKPTLAGLNRTELAIEMFLGEGQVAEQTVIDLFLQAHPELSEEIQHAVKQWGKSFQGLFVVKTVSKTDANGRSRYILMNWLTAKTYRAAPAQTGDILERASVGEIILARLVPLADAQADDQWIFSGPLTLLGKLGKPKLAVAIGNFKKWFPQQLYGDAPELKEAAWASVKDHYDEFVEFFGAERITLSGYELNKKLQVYQAQMTEKQLAEAGIDSSKSLKDIAQDAGLSETETTEAMDALGEESKIAKQLLDSKQSLKMVMPKITLPDDLRKAESVTVFVHPRWGQAFLKDHQQLENLLEQPKPTEEQTARVDRLMLKYLADEQVTTYVWQQLKQSHGEALESTLRRVLNQPGFDIEKDLDGAIAQHGRPLTPDLPETASVPIHLNDLFQEALQLVGGKPKGKKKKGKPQRKSGFGA